MCGRIMENNEKICQSCCMPLSNPDIVGTELTEKKVKTIASTAIKEGEFTQPKTTLNMMIDISSKIWAEKDPNVTVEQAKAQLKKKLPLLKRWCK